MARFEAVLLGLGLITFMLTSPAQGDDGGKLRRHAPDPASVEFASRVKERHESTLLSVPGVVGVGVGLAPDTGEIMIEVYVTGSTGVDRALPDSLEGIRVGIVETGEFRSR